MNILGIDEAGRGPVLGPMVVAGIVVSDEKVKVLERMGIKDSKRLTPHRRKVLSRKLKNMFHYYTVTVTAKDIDNLRACDVNLNEIEKIAMLKIIEALKDKTDLVIIDSLDVKPERLEDEVKSVFPNLDIKAEHKADDKYLPVAATSILAKVERDELIAEINKEYLNLGGIGSGYPSDPKTKKFLTNFTYDEMPDFVRKSWNTVLKLKEDLNE